MLPNGSVRLCPIGFPDAYDVALRHEARNEATFGGQGKGVQVDEPTSVPTCHNDLQEKRSVYCQQLYCRSRRRREIPKEGFP